MPRHPRYCCRECGWPIGYLGYFLCGLLGHKWRKVASRDYCACCHDRYYP